VNTDFTTTRSKLVFEGKLKTRSGYPAPRVVIPVEYVNSPEVEVGRATLLPAVINLFLDDIDSNIGAAFAEESLESTSQLAAATADFEHPRVLFQTGEVAAVFTESEFVIHKGSANC